MTNSVCSNFGYLQNTDYHTEIYCFQFYIIKCPNEIFMCSFVCFVCVCFICHGCCPLLFVSVCCAVSVIGHLAIDSPH